MNINCLFVYGTFIYEDQDPSQGINTPKYIENVRTGWVKGRLYQTKGFPFLVLDGDDKVRGKVFKCSDIKPLIEKYDKIEGVNDANPFFDRVSTKVHIEDGEKEKAHLYVAGSKLRNKYMDPKNRIEEEHWLDWLKNNI